MIYVIKRLDAKFTAKLFGISSAITMSLMLVLLRILIGTIIDASQSIQGVAVPPATFVENLILGKALTVSLLVLVPTTFCAGFISGYLFAILHNAVASSTNLIKVSEGSFEFK